MNKITFFSSFPYVLLLMYRNTTDLSNPTTFWIPWLILTVFSWILYNFVYIRLYHQSIKTIILLSFQFGCLLSWMIALAKTSSIILNRSGESGHSCLITDLKSFQSFTVEHDGSYGLIIHDLYYVELCYSIPNLLSILIMKRCCILSQAFFLSLLRWSYKFYPYSINVTCHINWFLYVELSLYLRDKSYLVTVYDPFNAPLNLFC